MLRALLFPALALIALAGPWLLGGGAAVFSAFVLIAIFATMAYGLDVIVSDLGEVSLAHPVFFACGAYATAISTTRLGFGPVESLALTVLAALALAAVLQLRLVSVAAGRAKDD